MSVCIDVRKITLIWQEVYTWRMKRFLGLEYAKGPAHGKKKEKKTGALT